MTIQDEILTLAKKTGRISTAEIATRFAISRQHAHRLIQHLMKADELIKIHKTYPAFYIVKAYAQKHPELLPNQYTKTFKNSGLEEHVILEQIEKNFSPLKKLHENISSIFTFGFSEMLNNAIEHSESKNISLNVSIQNNALCFTISDNGIGAFRNIMKKHKLKSEFEAMQDLLKGKTTTMPKSHSGEGIFFTSKAADLFILDSFGYQLIINNKIPDVFIQQTKKIQKGTQVTFAIDLSSKKHLNDIFSQYTNLTGESDHGFDKTEIKIKLYTIGGIYISRSQARRVLTGLNKFKIIVFDFDKVAMIGQAFADEIFRVFHHKYPQIKLETIDMNASIKFMIERAQTEAKRK